KTWLENTEAPPGPRPRNLAEREGFEPSVRFYPYNGLANRPFRPLRHLSGLRTDRETPGLAEGKDFSLPFGYSDHGFLPQKGAKLPPRGRELATRRRNDPRSETIRGRIDRTSEFSDSGFWILCSGFRIPGSFR